jgi:hypothetical protein
MDGSANTQSFTLSFLAPKSSAKGPRMARRTRHAESARRIPFVRNAGILHPEAFGFSQTL